MNHKTKEKEFLGNIKMKVLSIQLGKALDFGISFGLRPHRWLNVAVRGGE